ncbi:MAG: replicative DNA helicase, partial [Gammaproteobacteria bacterium]|nr:replicative DNA helicase [Gammaproteobacteria bacterium]
MPNLSNNLKLESFQLRTPPHSVEAEACLLGGVMLDNTSWDIISGRISARDFYRYEHQLIFQSIESLIESDHPADVITVYGDLQKTVKVEEVGGLEYINSLAQYVPNASHTSRYVEIVREKSILRQILASSDEISNFVLTPSGRTASEVLDQAEQSILKIRNEGAFRNSQLQELKQLLSPLKGRVEDLAKNADGITGVPSGFMDFDNMTSGLQPGDLIILAARPSMGKTALAVNIAEHIAIEEGLPVVIFSLEMSASQLVIRVVGSVSNINQSHLQNGKLKPDEWEKFYGTLQKLENVNMYIDDTPGISTAELRATARRLNRKCGKLGLIVVDYLQLMSSANHEQDNRSAELGEIS